jgi:hypothetical protein
MPTTQMPTTQMPTTRMPTTQMPTTQMPTMQMPTTQMPTTQMPTTRMPTTQMPITQMPTTQMPTTRMPTTQMPTTRMPTTQMPTTQMPTTRMPTTLMPTTLMPTTQMPTTQMPTTLMPTTPFRTAMPYTFITTEMPNNTETHNMEMGSSSPQSSWIPSEMVGSVTRIEINYINNATYNINLTTAIDPEQLFVICRFYFSYFDSNDYSVSQNLKFIIYDDTNNTNYYFITSFSELINRFNLSRIIKQKYKNHNNDNLIALTNIFKQDTLTFLGFIIYLNDKVQTIWNFNDNDTERIIKLYKELCSKQNDVLIIKVEVYFIDDDLTKIIEMSCNIKDLYNNNIDLNSILETDVFNCSSNPTNPTKRI